MEPLFVVNDFGRGFDSRRLHHILFNSLERYGLFVVQCREISPWRCISIADTAGTAKPVTPKTS